MSDLASAMKRITGSEPSPEQIARILAIAHDLDIPKHDAMFPILVALDQYHVAFSEFPKRVNDSVNSSVKAAERAAELVVNDASKKVQTVVANSLEPLAASAFQRGVNKYLDFVAQDAADHARTRTIPLACAMAAFLLIAGIGLGWAAGAWARSTADSSAVAAAALAQKTIAAQLAQKDAQAQAMVSDLKAAQAQALADLNAARGWMGTTEGQLAYKFFTAGSGAVAAKCQGKNWTLGQTASGQKLCMPQHKSIFGWREGDSGWVIP